MVKAHGTKYISRVTGIVCNMVKKYLLRFLALRLPLSEIAAKSDGALSRIFMGALPAAGTVNERLKQLEALPPELVAYYKKRGVTKQMAYALYRTEILSTGWLQEVLLAREKKTCLLPEVPVPEEVF